MTYTKPIHPTDAYSVFYLKYTAANPISQLFCSTILDISKRDKEDNITRAAPTADTTTSRT